MDLGLPGGARLRLSRADLPPHRGSVPRIPRRDQGGDRLRIAIVTPYVARIFGNRCAFVLARELARAHDVTVFAHTVATGVVDEVRSKLGSARLDTLTTRPIGRLRMSRLLWLQLARGPDRALAARIAQRHRENRFDAIVVISDEGHWLADYVRRSFVAPRPVTVVCILELLDHAFLLGYDRPFPAARRLLSPAYALVHGIEARRLEKFDRIVAISRWSAAVLDYLYGLRSAESIATYDDGLFLPQREPVPDEGYLAVPTAALDDRTAGLIRRLHADGIRLRTYGPKPVPPIPHAGFVADTEMVAILSKARGTVFLFDYEALGLIPIESLAVGTPVITWPREGPLLEHEGNANVHFVGTYPELLEACRSLAATSKTATSISECGNSVDRYRPALVAGRLVRLIEATAPSGRP